MSEERQISNRNKASNWQHILNYSVSSYCIQNEDKGNREMLDCRNIENLKNEGEKNEPPYYAHVVIKILLMTCLINIFDQRRLF